MQADQEINWTGWGRWLSFTLSAVLILVAIPAVFDHHEGAAAGWNIFLGLLMFGAVASGNRKAPKLAIVLTILMAVRVLIAIIFMPNIGNLLLAAFCCAIAAAAAYGLREQAKTLQTPPK